jgi:Uma2 family endonuclease
VAFFSNERLKREPRPTGYSTVAPDLCVEIVSPGDRWSDLADKVDEYLAAGVRLVWVIDPARRKAHVYAPKRPPQVLQGKQKLDGEDVLPGFKLALDKLFAELD